MILSPIPLLETQYLKNLPDLDSMHVNNARCFSGLFFDVVNYRQSHLNNKRQLWETIIPNQLTYLPFLSHWFYSEV